MTLQEKVADIESRGGLSPKELLAAQFATLGFQPSEIAQKFECQPRTVTTHLLAARRKTGSRRNSQLGQWLYSRGLHAFQQWPPAVLRAEGFRRDTPAVAA